MIRPKGWPSAAISKKTFGLPIFSALDAKFLIEIPKLWDWLAVVVMADAQRDSRQSVWNKTIFQCGEFESLKHNLF